MLQMTVLLLPAICSAGRAIQAVPMTLSSGLDLKSIYRPPSSLQLPGGGSGLEMQESNFSQAESMSSSSSQSSIGSSHGIQTELAAESHIVTTNKPRNISEVKRQHICGRTLEKKIETVE